MTTANAKAAAVAARLHELPKRVGFIIPPSGFLLDERVFMSLGVLILASILRSFGIKVEMLDLSGVKNFKEALEDYAKHTDLTVYGITATTPQMPAVVHIVEVLRKIRPQARLILGGPHITLTNAAAKKEAERRAQFPRAATHLSELANMFDVLVAGDGEHAIFEALQPNAPKLVDADNRHSELFLTKDEVGKLPWAARDLVDVQSYHYSIEGKRAISTIGQRGCPMPCAFCGGRGSPMLRNHRIRSIDDVVAEKVHLFHTYGVEAFMDYDDELNINHAFLIAHMEALAAKQKELGVQWSMRGFIKSELFNARQAAAMYAAGYRWILVGFESGDPRILFNIKKQATAEENSRCLQIAHQHGLKVKALMSVGHPGESAQTIEETRQWLLAEQPDDFDVSLITCYPGTDYYDKAVPVNAKEPNGDWVYTAENGDRLYMDSFDPLGEPLYYKGDPNEGYHSHVYTDYLSRKDLVRLRGYVEDSVRKELNIPFNPGAPGILYEHSMGLPGPNILRVSNSDQTVPVLPQLNIAK